MCQLIYWIICRPWAQFLLSAPPSFRLCIVFIRLFEESGFRVNEYILVTPTLFYLVLMMLFKYKTTKQIAVSQQTSEDMPHLPANMEWYPSRRVCSFLCSTPTCFCCISSPVWKPAELPDSCRAPSTPRIEENRTIPCHSRRNSVATAAKWQDI